MLYLLIVLLPTLLITGLASAKVQLAFNRYSKQLARTGMSGAEAARRMLDASGLTDVKIQPTSGYLTDHYNPDTRTLGLSSKVYARKSVAAIGVACHEAGHALQHKRGYLALQLRSAIVPVAGISSGLAVFLMAVGVAYRPLLLVGIVLFSVTVIAQLITLPVEFDASARAKRFAVAHGLVTEDEQVGMDRVLSAAALTYVAAAATSILTLLYFMWQAGFFSKRDSR